MHILGIFDGHNATAALLKDGKIITCISEERFTRVKNQAGFPKKSAEFVLKQNKLSPQGIDYVAYAGTCLSSDEDLIKYLDNLSEVVKGKKSGLHVIKGVLDRAGILESSIEYHKAMHSKRYERIRQDKKNILEKMGFSREKIFFTDHHKCHAATAYYGSHFNKEKTLVITCDGGGDFSKGKIFVGENGKMTEILDNPMTSPAQFYLELTIFLGLKPLEHEYKVMGLAPYVEEKRMLPIYNKMKEVIWLDKDKKYFKTKPEKTFFQFFKENFLATRFDWIAAGGQKLLEDLMLDWIKAAIQRTGIHNIAVAGGVFMNVKLNQRILELPEVIKLFIFPSCSDESLPIGACYMLYREKTDFKGDIPPFGSPHLGITYSNDEIKKFIEEKGLDKKYTVTFHNDIEKKTAELLAQGKIVARLKGPCEFGARALGNRSILVDPSDTFNVHRINKAIKIRDFWMPFCPSILAEDENMYIVNPKHMPAQYMIISFDANKNNFKEIIAATHQFDRTARPQIVQRDLYPEYYKLLKYFKDLTGRGAVLNTSFNLHGDPMVCSPEDAIYTLENSGLNYLTIENWLIEKKDKTDLL